MRQEENQEREPIISRRREQINYQMLLKKTSDKQVTLRMNCVPDCFLFYSGSNSGSETARFISLTSALSTDLVHN